MCVVRPNGGGIAGVIGPGPGARIKATRATFKLRYTCCETYSCYTIELLKCLKIKKARKTIC